MSDELSDEDRAKKWISINDLLNTDRSPLTELIEETVADSDEEAVFLFVGAKGRAKVTGKQLTEFRYCDAAIQQATGMVCDHCSAAKWREVRVRLMRVRTTVVLSVGAGPVGDTRARIVRHLEDSAVLPGDDRRERSLALDGFRRIAMMADGQVWFSVERMISDAEGLRVRTDRRAIYRSLPRLGSPAARKFSYDRPERGWSGDGKPLGELRRTSRDLWPVPPTIVAELWPDHERALREP